MKSILTIVDNDNGNAARLDAATRIASKFNAHVDGLHVIPQREYPMGAGPSVDFIAGPENIYPPGFIEEQKRKLKARAQELWVIFSSLMKRSNVNFEMYKKEGNQLEFMNMYSRGNDVTIISQGTNQFSDIIDINTQFMLESGLPVLAVPHEISKSNKIGDNILIAWANCPEAARAVTLALPVLKLAKTTVICSIRRDDSDDADLKHIEKYLKRHGIKVKIEQSEASETTEQAILEAARKHNSDLIVAGAWGHSRVKQIIMGGVTKSLFTNQEFPVFFVH